MRKSDFYFELPKELIAQAPIENRDDARLMALDKRTGATTHTEFKRIGDYINPGDCLVINDTKVIPARLLGESAKNGAPVEIFLLTRIDANTWEALAKPGKRAKAGDELSFGDGRLSARITAVNDDGNRVVRFGFDGVFEEVLDALGETPLPPYITQKLADKERYQTVYARNPGSVAAPTAGLHFTPEILEQLTAKGVRIARITLHVGLGTFRPVKADNILEHRMHAERFDIPPDAAETINAARKCGGRIIAVGTTSCRTLEARAGADGTVRSGSGETDIFIYPGYRFKAVDALITNFHLPESTLIMLVSAMAGRENTLAAYAAAAACGYRFFSFGDCMLIV